MLFLELLRFRKMLLRISQVAGKLLHADEKHGIEYEEYERLAKRHRNITFLELLLYGFFGLVLVLLGIVTFHCRCQGQLRDRTTRKRRSIQLLKKIDLGNSVTVALRTLNPSV